MRNIFLLFTNRDFVASAHVSAKSCLQVNLVSSFTLRIAHIAERQAGNLCILFLQSLSNGPIADC